MKNNMYLVGYEGWGDVDELMVVIEDDEAEAVAAFLNAIEAGHVTVPSAFKDEPIYVYDITNPIVFGPTVAYQRRDA